MSWHQLQKQGHGPHGKRSKSVYLSEAGLMTISKEFFVEMGEPLYTEIYFDETDKIIGLIPTDTPAENAYSIKQRDKTNSSPAITCKRLVMQMPHGRYLVEDKLDGQRIVLRLAENYG